MENHPLNLTPPQCRELQELVNLLVSRYEPSNIICFGCNHNTKTVSSCFIRPVDYYSCHYFLLMATTESGRIEHEVQDFVNANFSGGSITILAHGKDTISHAISQGNRFFIAVFRDGFQLYAANGLRIMMDYPNMNPATTLTSAEEHFFHRIPLAEGFLKGAHECLANQHYNICTFMLHQVVEQCCIVLIRVHMAYRSDFHNLQRLLNLCRCFSDQPYKMLLSGNPVDSRLFDILIKSYSQARYASTFFVDKNDAGALYDRVSSFVQLTKSVCIVKMEELHQLALLYKQQKGGSGVEHE